MTRIFQFKALMLTVMSVMPMPLFHDVSNACAVGDVCCSQGVIITPLSNSSARFFQLDNFHTLSAVVRSDFTRPDFYIFVWFCRVILF
jgi:hypothetical protein